MIVLVLFALVLLVYLPALYANPIWDDMQMFNEPYQDRTFKGNFLRQARWITDVTFVYTFRFFQRFKAEWRPTMIVSALHLGNSLIHFLNALIVYCIAEKLVGDRAMVAALIFAVHPLAASAVAPIVSRSSILSSTFIYLSVLLTLSGHPFLALPLVALAFWAKEDGLVSFFLIVALTGIYSPMTALELLGVGLLLGQRFFDKFWTMAKLLLKNNGDLRMQAAGLPGSLPQPQYSATALIENLRRWPLWVLGFELNPDPDPKPRDWRLAVCTLAVLLTFVAAMWNTALFPMLLIVLCSPWAASWFFRLPDPVSELRAYSTLLAISLMWSYLPIPLVIPAIVWFATISGYRCWLQQNEMSLWKHAWNEGSKKLRVAINLGAAHQKYGKIQEAFDWHKEAMTLSPNNGLVLINMALWFEGRAKLERQAVSTQFIGEGKLDQKTITETSQSANGYLAQAVVLAREAVHFAPDDQWVQHYHKAIENHASGLGMQVEVTKEQPPSGVLTGVGV